MAFDMAFDFREHAIFVTDPAFGVAVLGEAYPTTYTNGNGQSINAGRQSVGHFQIDNDATFDPRIAGANYGYDVDGYFQVDLGSGSAPGAGNYNVDIAIGYFATKQDFTLFDNSTILIDGTNGGAGTVLSSGHFLDATLTDRVGSSSWNGTPVAVTFASTTAKLRVQHVAGSNTFLAQFRLTQSAAATAPKMLTLLGVGT